MRLRNKKTGEIVEPLGITTVNNRTFIQFNDGKGTFKFEAHSLANLNEDWEDAPEEKHYFISNNGQIHEEGGHDRYRKERQEMGNDFPIEEEAEKAVEKLKAWKRLEDNGFMFNGIRLEGSDCLIKTKLKDGTGVSLDNAQQFYEDVDLLFGGEE